MEYPLLEFTEPYTNYLLTAGALGALWFRESLGRGHLLAFAGIGALTFLGTFAWLIFLLAPAGQQVNSGLALFLLRAMAMISVVCASATSMSVLLLTLRRCTSD